MYLFLYIYIYIYISNIYIYIYIYILFWSQALLNWQIWPPAKLMLLNIGPLFDRWSVISACGVSKSFWRAHAQNRLVISVAAQPWTVLYGRHSLDHRLSSANCRTSTAKSFGDTFTPSPSGFPPFRSYTAALMLASDIIREGSLLPASNIMKDPIMANCKATLWRYISICCNLQILL